MKKYIITNMTTKEVLVNVEGGTMFFVTEKDAEFYASFYFNYADGQVKTFFVSIVTGS